MGVYLSSPATTKFSVDKKCKKFTYGASSMQGWRVYQEDAHNCVPVFDEDTSLFAVYDGHGGSEVAQYCANHLPDYIKQTEAYKEGNLSKGLEDAFLGFDEVLTFPHVIKELKLMAGVDEDAEEKEAGAVPASRNEADMLRAEANMPIEDVLARYDSEAGSASQLLKTKNASKLKFISPFIRSKCQSAIEKAGGDTDFSGVDKNIQSSHSREDNSTRLSLESKLANGHADNDNNLNIEKEIRQSSAATPGASIISPDESGNNISECENSFSNGNTEENKGNDSSSDQQITPSSTTGEDSCKTGTAISTTTSSSSTADSKSSITTPSSTTTEDPDPSSCTKESQPGGSTPSSTSQEPQTGTSSSYSSAEAGGSGCSSTTDEPQPVGSGSSSCTSVEPQPGGIGCTSTSDDALSGGFGQNSEEPVAGSSSGLTTSVLDLDDSDDDDSEDYEQGSSGEDEESEDGDEEESEEEEELEDIDGMECSENDVVKHEEPGSDSGCTAVLAILKDRQLVVANAGDSRCVLCRDGNAVDLSFDHKPEDLPEQKRIEKAGGKVTPDGRVNGGLNLSRALGDHFYKKNTELPAKDQMITAFPDIQTTTLGQEDEFIVLACDGIWNYMNSQDVVDFVKKKLQDPLKRETPSVICEEIFDHCLAPNTMGDGTGCDNMTCILVLLHEDFRAAGPSVVGLTWPQPAQMEGESSGTKREACHLDSSPDSFQSGKKPRLSEADTEGEVDSTQTSIDHDSGVKAETKDSCSVITEQTNSDVSNKDTLDERVRDSDGLTSSEHSGDSSDKDSS